MENSKKFKIETKKNFRKNWKIFASETVQNTRNPIREIIENLNFEPNPKKEMIALSIGDPTVFGNLSPDLEIINAIQKSLISLKHNGYAPSTGYQQARQAIAKYTSALNNVNVTENDVIICSGCSGAIELCITALANSGQNILVPRPGFAIYGTLAEGLGIEIKHYNLIPERNWEIDLNHMESLIDEFTVAIVLINPSNPCGSVYSADHLRSLLYLANQYKLPIIADEIYEHIVFPNNIKFKSLASLSEEVPILSCSGLAKRFLVPGWRLGWIIVHDRMNVFDEEIRTGLQKLSQRILGANTLVQGALCDIFNNTPEKFHRNLLNVLHENAKLAYDILESAPGLKPIMPQGAMYMMVGIDLLKFSHKNSLEFVKELVEEESVFCLPGECFNYPGYIRLVITVPYEMLKEACSRIIEFCNRHYLSIN